ncbi:MULTISPECIES: oxidoreductase [Pyrobaculum]|uniref:Sulfurtransferase TusA family protein n=3 Tax=Pyrobaculum TaxID=2276 RepID=A4WH47_PYRAR|nr:oxidoreductase [Pyrobaculum arsenaticum]ABP49714.1 conserved hypothetical protein [Pyrobaculum arsenaticum DSM 13514]AFA40417.1 hypothetical protein Pogu_2390 [Pyrobaculum oguniense TE7]MCY0890852.1 sulfurtransferase TusA family protein [Pyrobaculum arsenaticum]NYR15700.1 sulfurtransferase TusA family protein [Pyrobaculum arsenaticum]
MRKYEVKGPCPELGMVLARAAAELKEGEEALIVSTWKYVVNDLKNSAPLLNLEVIKINDLGDVVEVAVRKSGPTRHL